MTQSVGSLCCYGSFFKQASSSISTTQSSQLRCLAKYEASTTNLHHVRYLVIISMPVEPAGSQVMQAGAIVNFVKRGPSTWP